MGSGADKDWIDEDAMQMIEDNTCSKETYMKEANALTKQEGGSHYKNMKIQPIEFITANDLGFIEGCVVKYICRHADKNGAEDIRKIIHYCELLLQTKYK
jgi:hypothetical protein